MVLMRCGHGRKMMRKKLHKMPTGQIKWLPSQHALLCEILVINLIEAFNYSGRLIHGMC